MVWRGYGQIVFDPWESSWVRFVLPGKEAIWWNSGLPLALPMPLPFVSDAVKVKAKSLDGTEIPFLLLAGQGSGKAKGLLVIGYGAYGLPIPFMTQRWQPLLTRGWSIAIGLWRGGGDHTPEWEDAGRVYGRKKVLEDAEAVVRKAQSIVKVGSSHTVLYGRSAGGLWVGGLAAKFPKGELASGAYMEVPYLDVLRTITNRNLPLTEIETDEFGLPEQRLSDFAGALEWSPMELLVCGKGTYGMSGLSRIPGMWQIVRTGLNDSEVLAYESVKWIVRSKNPSAFLAIEGGQGHFVSGSRGFLQQAEDLALILSKVNN
jgi:oligopeptidase B